MRLLGVDVDQVVVEPNWIDWLIIRGQNNEVLDWLHAKAKYHYEGEKPLYNLGKYFPSIKDPMDFWRELDYSKYKPLPGVAEKLTTLSNHFGIVFISRETGNHGHSKFDWLEKHFPFMEGYLATREKHVMNKAVVAHFDDRVSNLAKFDPHKRILFNTVYKQEDEYKDTYVHRVIHGWADFDVRDFCKEYI